MWFVPFLVACGSSPREPGSELPSAQGWASPGTSLGTTPVPPAPPDCVPAARLVINELQPSNAEVLVDEDGDSVDWIELHNPGGEAVDLGGWLLSDDPEPGDWRFPPIRLDPGGFLLVYASGKDRRQHVEAWETRIDLGHTWRWLEVREPPPAGWTALGFDDRGWASGPSGFGHGDGDDATRAVGPTVYARTVVELSAADLAELGGLALHVDHDDGFVAWLNGVEVARSNLGFPGDPVPWDAAADAEREASRVLGHRPERFDLWPRADLLREGANVLALEVHDASPTSDDLSLAPFLSLGFRSEREVAASPRIELPLARPHTDFALGSEGERVRLFDPAGCEVDALEPGDVARADFSFGRVTDGGEEVGWFAQATPGAPNVTEARPGFTETPTFDPPPGFRSAGVEVTITSDESPASDTLGMLLDPSGPEWPNPPWSTELFRLLMTSPEFEEAFVNAYADAMNTSLSPEAGRAALDELADAVAEDIPRQISRWGTWSDGATTRELEDGVWESEIRWIDRWLGERPAHARAHVVANLGLTGTWTLRVEADPPGSGTIELSTVEVALPFTGVYFRGVPVTITARPAPGSTFAGWSDERLPATATVTLPAGGLAAPLTARFR